VEGVEHGTELAGRYRLEERLRSTGSGESWRAVDTTLDRPVAVRLVPHGAATDVLDAARRAAVVEDTALLRVLDVAQEPGSDGPVTYVVSEHVDAVPLGDLLRRGPLPADQVRALVGQAATALAAASAAGLHHEALTPDHVLCRPEGGVKVEGLAVEAAAQGRPAATAEDAARADAVGLVALLHAGLTGTWPLDPVPGLPASPRDGGVLVPPGELVDDVPNDLDTLCAVTFGTVDDGPRTPQELVEELRPWDAGLRPATAARGPQRPAGRFPRRPGAGAAAGAAAGVAAGAGAAGAAAAAGPAPDETAAISRADLFGDEATAPVSFAKTADGPPADDAPHDAPHDGPDDGYEEYDDGYEEYDDGYAHEYDDDDGYDEREERSSRSPMIALGVLALLVVVGLFLAIQAIGGIELPGGDDTAQPSTSASSSAAPPPSESEAPPAAGAQVSGVRTLDPGGGDGENDETAPAAIDDDPESFWRSSTYRSAEFGGLKDGVGLVVTLTAAAPVSEVTLQVNGSGGVVELRSAPGQGLEGSEVIGTASPATGTITLTPDEPVTTQHLVIWFTELPEVDGDFRIELADVAVA
jgi:hypothetical protein